MSKEFTLAAALALILWGTALPASAAGTAEDVFLKKCSVCHGPDGAGKTARGKKLKLRDLRSPEVQKLTDTLLNEITAKGKGKEMPGYEKELDKDTIQQIVAFLRQLDKK